MIHLRSCRLKHFKAIRDTQTLRFEPLTAFIGNNGSGKSSVIEALATYQAIIRDGLDAAMTQWVSFEHVRNHATTRRMWTAPKSAGDRPRETEPMSFQFALRSPTDRQRKLAYLGMDISAGQGGNELFIAQERLRVGTYKVTRDARGGVHSPQKDLPNVLDDGESLITTSPRRRGLAEINAAAIAEEILGWQFLLLQPEKMGSPRPQQRAGGRVRLVRDGSNIAEYLRDIQRLDDKNKTAVFQGIVDGLRYVLDYASDLKPKLTSELERSVYLELTEGKFVVPGWLLSTGTLRILALLSVLRHPQPPPLLVIEEIENGLDPRTIHLMVEEIRNAVESGRTQVIMTTHSPYLLNLLRLEHIVMVERDESGEPKFRRPADDKQLKSWAESFAPGELYTMGRLKAARPS